jgi:hypothetical protein
MQYKKKSIFSVNNVSKNKSNQYKQIILIDSLFKFNTMFGLRERGRKESQGRERWWKVNLSAV